MCEDRVVIVCMSLDFVGSPHYEKVLFLLMQEITVYSNMNYNIYYMSNFAHVTQIYAS